MLIILYFLYKCLLTIKCFIQSILKFDKKEQKGKYNGGVGLEWKEGMDILYKIKLDDAAVAMGICIT